MSHRALLCDVVLAIVHRQMKMQRHHVCSFLLVALTLIVACLPTQNIDGAWKKQQEFDAARAAWLKTVQMQQQQQPLQPEMQAQQQHQQVAMAQPMYPDAGMLGVLVCTCAFPKHGHFGCAMPKLWQRLFLCRQKKFFNHPPSQRASGSRC